MRGILLVLGRYVILFFCVCLALISLILALRAAAPFFVLLYFCDCFVAWIRRIHSLA